MENLINYFEKNKRPLIYKGQALDGVSYKEIQDNIGNIKIQVIRKAGYKISYVQLDGSSKSSYYLTK